MWMYLLNETRKNGVTEEQEAAVGTAPELQSTGVFETEDRVTNCGFEPVLKIVQVADAAFHERSVEEGAQKAIVNKKELIPR